MGFTLLLLVPFRLGHLEHPTQQLMGNGPAELQVQGPMSRQPHVAEPEQAEGAAQRLVYGDLTLWRVVPRLRATELSLSSWWVLQLKQGIFVCLISIFLSLCFLPCTKQITIRAASCFSKNQAHLPTVTTEFSF